MRIHSRTLFQQWLVVVLVMLFAITTAGCGLLATKPAQTAKQYIDEANVLLNAAAKVIKDNVRTGAMTKSEGQKKLDKVKEYAEKVDKASDLLASGNKKEAFSKAKLVNKLVVDLHKEVSKRARSQ